VSREGSGSADICEDKGRVDRWTCSTGVQYKKLKDGLAILGWPQHGQLLVGEEMEGV
jgi:hypothetical protein